MRKRKHDRFREDSHALLPEAMPFVRACGSGERGRVVRGLREAAAGYSRAVFRVACRKTGLHTGMPCAAAVQEPFRSSLWRFKFKNETKLAKPLAKLMLPAIDKNRVWDCIVPVPISRERLKQRGYDQSVLLAKEVSKLTGIPCRTDILEEEEDQPHAAQFERQGT